MGSYSRSEYNSLVSFGLDNGLYEERAHLFAAFVIGYKLDRREDDLMPVTASLGTLFRKFRGQL